MSYTIQGQILEIYDAQQLSEKFTKREFVIITEGQYAEKPIFQLANDNCSKLDNFKIGDKVEVSFNLKGRSWESPTGETRYFNTLDCWKIEKLNNAPQVPVPVPTPNDEGTDTLPF